MKAIHDLKNELEKMETVLSEELQQKLWSSVIDLFRNKTEEIRILPLICIVPLMKKLSPERMPDALQSIYDVIASPKQEPRDAARIAWKKIFTEIPYELLPEEEQEISLDIQLGSIDSAYNLYTKYYANRQQNNQ